MCRLEQKAVRVGTMTSVITNLHRRPRSVLSIVTLSGSLSGDGSAFWVCIVVAWRVDPRATPCVCPSQSQRTYGADLVLIKPLRDILRDLSYPRVGMDEEFFQNGAAAP